MKKQTKRKQLKATWHNKKILNGWLMQIEIEIPIFIKSYLHVLVPWAFLWKVFLPIETHYATRPLQVMLIISRFTIKRCYLDHSWMVSGVITRPWGTILHNPSFFRNLLCLGNKPIDTNFKFFILSLQQKVRCKWYSRRMKQQVWLHNKSCLHSSTIFDKWRLDFIL